MGDPPVLKAFFRTLHNQFGAFKRIASLRWTRNSLVKNSLRQVKTTGKAIFERGEASLLIVQNGHGFDHNILALQILPLTSWKETEWLELLDISFYKQKAENFLNAFVTEKATKAYSLMHPSLQKNFTIEELQSVSSQWKTLVGKVARTKAGIAWFLVNHRTEGQQLQLQYVLRGSKNGLHATIKFEFQAMKGHLIAFKVNVVTRAEVEAQLEKRIH